VTRLEEEALRKSIVEALENWWDSGAQALDVRMPYVGPATFDLMALAASAILFALDDAQRNMINDGIVKSDDF
jgi:hypothetical protein